MRSIGLLALSALTCSCACSVGPAPVARGHEHAAPHGGTLVELGDEFAHVEFVHDSVAGTLTAYLLDGEAESAIRVTAPTMGVALTSPARFAARPYELLAQSSILTGETIGNSSEFTLSHEAFRHAEPITGVVLDLDVRGQRFRDVPFAIGREQGRAP
jgi:hypothetical protein